MKMLGVGALCKRASNDSKTPIILEILIILAILLQTL